MDFVDCVTLVHLLSYYAMLIYPGSSPLLPSCMSLALDSVGDRFVTSSFPATSQVCLFGVRFFVQATFCISVTSVVVAVSTFVKLSSSVPLLMLIPTVNKHTEKILLENL